MKSTKKIYYLLPFLLVLVLVKYFDTDLVSHRVIKNADRGKAPSFLQEKKIKQKDRPDLAVLQNNEMTLDPALGYPPVERSIKAFEALKASRKNARTVDQAEWVERGPLRVAGRTRTLMFDPNDPTQKKVFAGAIGGGIWYTEDITNPNVRWNSVDDFMANLAVSSIVHDPTNTQVFYASTGLGFTGAIRGVGIFKSDDAGNTWSHLNSTDNEDFHFVQKLAVLGNGNVLAGTSSGLYISRNDGASWVRIKDEGVADIKVDANDNIYISVNFNSGVGTIYKSTDIGANWTEITPAMGGNRIEMAIAPSDEQVIYAVASGGGDVAWFYKSNDGGETWDAVTIPSYLFGQSCVPFGDFTRGQAWFDLILAVHPTQPDVIIVGGIDLHRSLDGGQNWESMSYWTGACDDYVHADQHAIAFRPNHANEAIFGNDGGVFYSENVVAQNPDFIQRNLNYNVTTFNSLAYENTEKSNYFLAGAQDNGTQQFNFPGINDTREVAGGDGSYCFVDKDEPQIQITSHIFDSYSISTDGGESFQGIRPIGMIGRFVNPTEYDSKHNNLYAAGNSNELVRLLDVVNAERSLEVLDIDIGYRTITHLKISPYTDHRLFIGIRSYLDEAKLYRVDNVNTSSPDVTEITGTYEGSHGEWVSSIDVGESDDHLVATFSNYGVNSVYESKDGGTTWQNKEGNLPDMPIRWGVFNPQDRKEYILATELGVWATLDLGATSPDWQPINVHQANVRTDMVKVREADNLLIAATYGRGLFTSDVLIDAPQAFFVPQQVGYEGTLIDFSDLSHGEIISWNWDFGDGNSSSEQHPSHTYVTAGDYMVSLTVSGVSSTNTSTETITIMPKYSGTYSVEQGGNFEMDNGDFVSKALMGGRRDVWQRMDDGSGNTAWMITDEEFERSKTALYTPGFDLTQGLAAYSISLLLNQSSKYCDAPASLQLQYSVDGGVSWGVLGSSIPRLGVTNWYNRGNNFFCNILRELFEDQMGWTQTGEENIQAVHPLSDLQEHELIGFRIVYVYSPIFPAEDYELKTWIDDFQIIVPEPTSDFFADKQIAYVNTEINFSDFSSGAVSYRWDFGDGSTSVEQNPTHIYTQSGIFNVSLEIVDETGQTVTETKEAYIKIIPSKMTPYTLEDGGDLESGETDFLIDNVRGTALAYGNSTILFKDGTSSGDQAIVFGLTDSEYLANSEAYIYTPEFSFVGLGTYTLSFVAKLAFQHDRDGFVIEYTTTKGDTWLKLNPTIAEGWYNSTSNSQSVFGASVPIFSGATNGRYDTFSSDVSFLANNESVAFRVKVLTSDLFVNVGMALDDFQIIVQGPTSDFFADKQIAYVNTEINFSDFSSGAVSYRWDFGDGSTSVEQNPTHIYTQSGIFNVSLEIVDETGQTLTETKEAYIKIIPSKMTPYTLEDGGDLESGETDFLIDNVRGTALAYGNSTILFKDGTSSGDQAIVFGLTDSEYLANSEAYIYTPEFSFVGLGTYTLSFVAKFAFQHDRDGFVIEYTTTKGDTWLKLNPTIAEGWYNSTSNSQSVFGASVPIFSGATNGRYDTFSSDVSFLANNESVAFRVKVLTSDLFVNVGMALDDFQIIVQGPTSDFFADKQIAYVNTEINFSDFSSGAVSYRWDFGDGSTSVEQNPTHIYTQSGIFNVSLEIVDETGQTVTETKEAYIKIIPSKMIPYTLEDGGDLESGETDFLIDNVRGTALAYGNSTIIGKDGTSSGDQAIVFGLTDSEYLANSEAYIYTPEFSFVGLGTYTLSFVAKFAFQHDRDGFVIEYTTTKGDTWLKLNPTIAEGWYNSTSNSQSVFGASVPIFSGITNGRYDTFSSDVSFLANNESVAFRVKVLTSDLFVNVGMALDDFQIIEQGPTSDFFADKQIAYVNTEINFSDFSSGAVSYRWDFGDGSTSVEQNPTHIYTQSGIFNVSLEIVDETGQTVTETKEAYIKIIPSKMIPYTLEDGGDLESGETDFLIDNVRGTALAYGNSTIIGKDGTSSGDQAIVLGLTESEYLDESEAYVYTPEFSFVGLGTHTLSFVAKFAFQNDWDGFIVEYSTNKGNVWLKLNPTVSEGWYNSTSNSQSVFGASVPIFSGSTNGNYDAFSSDVSSLAGNESVAFRFKFLSDANTVDVGMALDDITLDGPDITQPVVLDFAVNSGNGCVGNVVTIENLSSGFITSILWDFGEGATPATAIGNGPFDVTYLSAGEKIITLTIANPTEGELVETKTVDIGAIHTPILTSSLVASTGKYVLTASEGDEYIWFKNGDTIRNENSQMLEVDLGDNNSYAVSVNLGGCWSAKTTSLLINAVNERKPINLYPTISKGMIHIEGLDNELEYHYEVMNISGKKITEGVIDVEDEKAQMNFNSLKEGLYLLRIKNKNSLSYNVQKIIIK